MKILETRLGGSRKTLPTGKARHVGRGPIAKTPVKSSRAKNPLDRNIEQDLVKTFGEKVSKKPWN
jgi:hypothetical protein